MAEERRVSLADARGIGERLGADWDAVDPAELRRGIEVERDSCGSDLEAGRLALARLREVPDYYTRLDELAAAAEKHLARRHRL
jgi:hypothetical protein